MQRCDTASGRLATALWSRPSLCKGVCGVDRIVFAWAVPGRALGAGPVPAADLAARRDGAAGGDERGSSGASPRPPTGRRPPRSAPAVLTLPSSGGVACAARPAPRRPPRAVLSCGLLPWPDGCGPSARDRLVARPGTGGAREKLSAARARGGRQSCGRRPMVLTPAQALSPAGRSRRRSVEDGRRLDAREVGRDVLFVCGSYEAAAS